MLEVHEAGRRAALPQGAAVNREFLQNHREAVGQSGPEGYLFDAGEHHHRWPGGRRGLLAGLEEQAAAPEKRSDSGLGEALREVEKKCSEKTAKTLGSLSCEYRRLKERLSAVEKLEKEAKRAELKLGTAQEELMLLRKRVSDLEKTSKTAEEESLALRRKLKEMGEESKLSKLALSKSSGDLRAAQQTPADKLKKYLQEKQLHIFKKERQIKGIQESLRLSLEGSFGEEACGKCCQLMKRIRESIMKYRAYLQQQAKVAELLYNKQKLIFS